ncbi:MAG TPA: hypothetical protein VGK25_03705 [Ignavibacteria bacterium]
MKNFFLPILSLLAPLFAYSQTDSLFPISYFGELTDAASISSSRGEFIFVSDISINKVFKFNKEGKLLASYGGTGLGKNELNKPVSIDASNGLDVFVSDYLNNRLIRLDNNLNFISSFDFNLYNPGVESTKKIFNPYSISYLSTGELFVLSDAGYYKIIRIKDFNNVDLYFGQAYDKMLNPVKITKGNSLDVWILEKSSGELMNFNNLGIFVKRIKLPESLEPISITYSEDNLIILLDSGIYNYDLSAGKFSRSYYMQQFFQVKDITILNKETLLVLSKNRVFIYKLN